MQQVSVFSKSIASMTSHLDISIVYDSSKPQEAEQLIESGYEEANRLINIISAWQDNTELYAVNQNAGIQPVKVCDELFFLIKRSLKISNLTNGLFDVTFASIDKVWYFDRPMEKLPSEEEIAHSIRNIDYRFIQLNEEKRTVFIQNKGTKIELGAIGKGFIAQKIKIKLQNLGVSGGLINAGGDLITWGKNEFGEEWRVGIVDPEKKSKSIAWLNLENKAVATSGSYERFAEINGKKYAHIIHPKTGYPVSGLQSVTIISADAELCDAVATSIFLLGREKGLEFVNRFDDLQCFIVDENDNYYYSDNLKQRAYEIKN
ncbi:Thiamine biosynthesis lipoprotein ApbE precursor [compost metagenome]